MVYGVEVWKQKDIITSFNEKQNREKDTAEWFSKWHWSEKKKKALRCGTRQRLTNLDTNNQYGKTDDKRKAEAHEMIICILFVKAVRLRILNFTWKS